MKVGPDTGSRPTNESHLNGGVPRSGLLPGPHASPGLGANAFSPLLTTLNPYDCTIPPGFSGSVDVGLSFSPEKTQIELACDVAASFGVRLPGGPITSLAKAALALAPVRAAVQTATASNDFLRIAYLPSRALGRPGRRKADFVPSGSAYAQGEHRPVPPPPVMIAIALTVHHGGSHDAMSRTLIHSTPEVVPAAIGRGRTRRLSASAARA